MRNARPIGRRRRLVLQLLLLQHISLTILISASDYFCGTSWVDAMNYCWAPCPSGENSECASIDPDYECQGFTGCTAKLLLTDPPSGSPSRRPTARPTTQKPTNPLTDSPTGRPTTLSPTTTSPTSSPTAKVYTAGPSVSPTIKPYEQRVGATFLPSDLTSMSRSYGLIFDIATAASSPAVSVHQIELYTVSQNVTLDYEVLLRKGTWHGKEGALRRYTRVASGTVTVPPKRRVRREPQPLLLPRFDDPIKFDSDTRYAIYVTVSEKTLLYAPSSMPPMSDGPVSSIKELEGPTEDKVVLATSDELVLYEGAAVLAYPFLDARDSIWYRMPRGLVGSIRYHRDPCMGATTWEECEETRPPSPSGGVASKPTSSSGKGFGSGFGSGFMSPPSVAGATGEGLLPNDPLAPSVAPSASDAPSEKTVKANLILTFEFPQTGDETSAVLPGPVEVEAFETTVVDFFTGRDVLEANEVRVGNCKVHYQQFLVSDEDEEEEEEEENETTEGWRRGLQNGGFVVGGFAPIEQPAEQQQQPTQQVPSPEPPSEEQDGAAADAERQPQEDEATAVDQGSEDANGEGQRLNATEPLASVPPPTTDYQPPLYEPQPQKPPHRTLELTLILSLRSTPLPLKITAELLSSELRGNKAEFMELLTESPPSSSSSSSLFSGYFASASDMPTVLAVDEVTDPPTSRPTSSPTVTATLPEEDDSIDTTLLAVFVVLLMWCGSTAYGIRHVFRARRLRRLARIRQFVSNATASGYMGTRIYDDERKDVDVGKDEEDSFRENGEVGEKKSRRDRKGRDRDRKGRDRKGRDRKGERKKNRKSRRKDPSTKRSNGHGRRSRRSSNGAGARDRMDSQENFDDLSSMVDSYRESSDEYISEGEVEELSEEDEENDLI